MCRARAGANPTDADARAGRRDDPPTRATVQGGSGLIFATEESSREVALALRGRFSGCDIAKYSDRARGFYRLSAFRADRLVACMSLAPAELKPDWELAKSAFAVETVTPADRRSLLSGRTAAASAGPPVCACHGVGLDVITAAIAAGAGSVEAVGGACRAGTNCGSCIPEIRKRLTVQAVSTLGSSADCLLSAAPLLG